MLPWGDVVLKLLGRVGAIMWGKEVSSPERLMRN